MEKTRYIDNNDNFYQHMERRSMSGISASHASASTSSLASNSYGTNYRAYHREQNSIQEARVDYPNAEKYVTNDAWLATCVSSLGRFIDAASRFELDPSFIYPLSVPFSVALFPSGFFTLQPNQQAVILHFGSPTEVVNEPGCHYAHRIGRQILVISTAPSSYHLSEQKILDKNGCPLIVSAVVTYRFTDVVKASLDVNNATAYVRNQASASIKLVVGRFTYEELKTEGEKISSDIIKELQPRVDITGAVVSNVALNELNYAPEVAVAMLKKQQAAALIEARHLVVQGAIEICTQTVQTIEESGVKLAPHEKVAIITNLLTITAGDKDPTPVISIR